MRNPSLTVAAVLCAHLGVPSSFAATSTGNGAPAKIGVVDAAAFVVQSNNGHRTTLPTHSRSIAKSTAFETNRKLELQNILVSPASTKQTLTRLPSSIIDAPQTLSTSHNDDGDDGESFDAKLEADAEAFFEQMMARRSSIMQGAKVDEEPVASFEEGEKASDEVSHDMSLENTDVMADTTASENYLNAHGSPDHLEGKSDDEIAEEWHNDQMVNASASVQSMNGLAALESIEQEESRVHYEEWEQNEAEKQKVYEAAHVDSLGHDDYAFQQSRLERQLIQPRAEDSVTIEAFREESAEATVDVASESTSASNAFQRARLRRQLAQPRPLKPHPPLAEQGSDVPPSSDEPTSDVSRNSSINTDAGNIAFQEARLARQLEQPRSSSTELSPILHDASQDEEVILHLEVPKSELTKEEVQARRAYYKRIETLSEEIIQRASEAANRVLEEQHRQESETLDAIKEAVTLSAQSESTEIFAGDHPEDKGENEAEPETTMRIQIPDAIIDTTRSDVDENVVVEEAPSHLVEKEIRKTRENSGRKEEDGNDSKAGRGAHCCRKEGIGRAQVAN